MSPSLPKSQVTRVKSENDITNDPDVIVRLALDYPIVTRDCLVQQVTAGDRLSFGSIEDTQFIDTGQVQSM